MRRVRYPRTLSDQEKQALVSWIMWSEGLEGNHLPKERVERLLEQALQEPLVELDTA